MDIRKIKQIVDDPVFSGELKFDQSGGVASTCSECSDSCINCTNRCNDGCATGSCSGGCFACPSRCSVGCTPGSTG